MHEEHLRLEKHLVKWSEELDAYNDALLLVGETKSDLEYARAKLIQELRHREDKVSQAQAESVADADPSIYALTSTYRRAESGVSYHEKRLRWFSAVADALRSNIASAREQAKIGTMYSEG